MYPKLSDPSIIPLGCLNSLNGSEVVDIMNSWTVGEDDVVSQVLISFKSSFTRDAKTHNQMYPLSDEIIEWFNIQNPSAWFYLHLGHPGGLAHCKFFFSDPHDAILFKLTWSNG